MEDGATEAESILHPMQEIPEEEVGEVKADSDDKGSGGLIDHIFSNLVAKRETNEEKKEEEEIERDEKGGGILDQIISTLVSSKASTAERNKQEEGFLQFRNGGESEDHDKIKQENTMKAERENEEAEGGGSIIENIVSHFPKSLPDDAAPTTDEASILLHSIVHD